MKRPITTGKAIVGHCALGSRNIGFREKVNGELDGPYAVWQTDPNGIQVDCGCNVEQDPVAEAFFTALDDGADPDKAFQAAVNVARQIILEEYEKYEEEIQVLMQFATAVWQNAIREGLELREAFEAVVRAVQEREEGQGE